MDDALAIFFPFVSLYYMPYCDLESVGEHPFRWLCAAFFTITPLLAGIVAHRLEFQKYRLNGTRNALDALLGSFLCWPYCFPNFLKNRSLVLSGKAERKTTTAWHAEPARSVWPFVGLYLVYSGALFFFALPGRPPNPKRANEATAITCLKQYAAGQAAYRSRFDSGYCDAFSNLFYRPGDDDRPIALIPQRFADAAAAGGKTSGTIPYQGYVFYEDPYVARNALWGQTFALLAYPARPGRTGDNIYWIGEKGEVYMCGIPGGKREMRLITAEESPLRPGSTLEWREL